MMQRRTWEEFRDAKLLWWMNRSLQLFGWSIVVETDEKCKIIDVFPARVSFRGFNDADEADGFVGLTDYLKINSNSLADEIKEQCEQVSDKSFSDRLKY